MFFKLIRIFFWKGIIIIFYPICSLSIPFQQSFLEELERTVALLAFEDVSSCPVGELLDMSQRLKTASEVNAAILTSQSHEKGIKLSYNPFFFNFFCEGDSLKSEDPPSNFNLSCVYCMRNWIIII